MTINDVKKRNEKRLKPCQFVIIKTHYPDKFNRYFADIFYDRDETDVMQVAEKGVYFNQEILDKGLAENY